MGYTQNCEVWHGASLGILITIQEEPIWGTVWGPCLGHKKVILRPFLIHWVVKLKPGHSFRPLVLFFLYSCTESNLSHAQKITKKILGNICFRVEKISDIFFQKNLIFATLNQCHSTSGLVVGIITDGFNSTLDYSTMAEMHLNLVNFVFLEKKPFLNLWVWKPQVHGIHVNQTLM